MDFDASGESLSEDAPTITYGRMTYLKDAYIPKVVVGHHLTTVDIGGPHFTQ